MFGEIGGCSPDPQPEGPRMQSTRSLVLVVDDDHQVRWLIARSLESAGYAVEGAADGADALARLEAGGVDLLLLIARDGWPRPVPARPRPARRCLLADHHAHGAVRR